MASRRTIAETIGFFTGDTRMVRTVLYVSTRRFLTVDAARVVAGIVGPARARNAALGVTGALVATENHFAQLLEGPGDVIEMLMQSIARDPRHHDVTLLPRDGLPERRFEHWSLAYQGRSAYLEGFIRPLVARPATPRVEVDRLVDLMERLAAPAARRLSRGSGAP